MGNISFRSNGFFRIGASVPSISTQILFLICHDWIYNLLIQYGLELAHIMPVRPCCDDG